jgi:hypothetical protein
LWEHTGRRFELDDHLIGKWERGVVRQPIRQYRAALRAVLGVYTDAELGFRAPARPPMVASTAAANGGPHHTADARDDAPTLGDTDEVKRRELLRLFSMTGAMLALPPDAVDSDRLQAIASGGSRPDSAVVGDFARLNDHLWQVYGLAAQKKSILPLARDQLATLCEGLSRANRRDRPRICQLVSDVYQLIGEVFFDADQYADAAQCHLLASTAAQEAKAHDLWAAALTRHAFIAVYEQEFDKAVPMLDLAWGIAHRGDSEKATRYWVAAVRAEATAGIGDRLRCERDLETAAGVVGLARPLQNGGWLRFDGSRLPEQRGTCMISLGDLGRRRNGAHRGARAHGHRPAAGECAHRSGIGQRTARRSPIRRGAAGRGHRRRASDRFGVHRTATADGPRRAGGFARRFAHPASGP